jgi:hypothetical protein
VILIGMAFVRLASWLGVSDAAVLSVCLTVGAVIAAVPIRLIERRMGRGAARGISRFELAATITSGTFTASVLSMTGVAAEPRLLAGAAVLLLVLVVLVVLRVAPPPDRP